MTGRREAALGGFLSLKITNFWFAGCAFQNEGVGGENKIEPMISAVRI